MRNDKEIVFVTGDTELRITNDGRIQMRARKGTAVLERGFKVRYGKDAIELGSAITTTSTSWVDVSGLSFNTMKQILGKKESSKLRKILPCLKKHKAFFKQLSNNFPLELESLDLNFGIFKLKFKRKKKETSN